MQCEEEIFTFQFQMRKQEAQAQLLALAENVIGGRGVRACAFPGTAYVIPARACVWLVRGACRGRRFVAAPPPTRRAARHGGSVLFEVRFRGRGTHGCVLRIEIYKMCHRT